MNIIKQNPFRVLGLTSNATEKELQKQISIIKRYAEVGKSKVFDYDFAFIGNVARNSDDVQEASNQIEQAHKKLLYSLFWFVKNNSFDEIAFNYLKENDTEKAIEIWNKTLKDQITSTNYSSYCNLSTLYIALSIIDDKFELQKLQAGISLKGQLINSEILNDFSKLVTGNGVSEDPIEINKKFADEVIELLKPYLNKTNGISTNDLIFLFHTFPSSIKKYILSKFTEIPISAIENKIEKTLRKRKDNPKSADKYGEELFKSTKADLIQLKGIQVASNMQFRMIADKVANEILQCSISFFNELEEKDSDENFETNLNTAIKLAKLADAVAISDQVKEKVQEGINTLVEMKDRAYNQAIALLKSIKQAYITSEVEIMLQAKKHEESLGYGRVINWGKVDDLIKNSLDWDKVVELILKVIPKCNIEKIKNIKDDSKLKEFKELVKFVLDKINYSNKTRVNYLNYWKTTQSFKTKNIDDSSSSTSNDKEKSYIPHLIITAIICGIIGAIFFGIWGFFVAMILGFVFAANIFNL